MHKKVKLPSRALFAGCYLGLCRSLQTFVMNFKLKHHLSGCCCQSNFERMEIVSTFNPMVRDCDTILFNYFSLAPYSDCIGYGGNAIFLTLSSLSLSLSLSFFLSLKLTFSFSSLILPLRPNCIGTWGAKIESFKGERKGFTEKAKNNDFVLLKC
jgi:hypothetical protein